MKVQASKPVSTMAVATTLPAMIADLECFGLESAGPVEGEPLGACVEPVVLV